MMGGLWLVGLLSCVGEVQRTWIDKNCAYFSCACAVFLKFSISKKRGDVLFLKIHFPPRAISHSWEAPLQVFPLHFLETPRPSPSTTNF